MSSRSVCFGVASTWTRWVGDRCRTRWVTRSRWDGGRVVTREDIREYGLCVCVWRKSATPLWVSRMGLWSEQARSHCPATFIGYVGHTCCIRTTVKSSTPRGMDRAPITSSASRTVPHAPSLSPCLRAVFLSSSFLSRSYCYWREITVVNILTTLSVSSEITFK